MTDIKAVALNAPARVFRFFGRLAGGLAAMALLQLALLAAGPVSGARAQTTVQCSAGKASNTITDSYFLFDADAGTCSTTLAEDTPPAAPANGFIAAIDSEDMDITVSILRYENGANVPIAPGNFWSITGGPTPFVVNPGLTQIVDDIFTPADFSISTTVNAIPVTISISSLIFFDNTIGLNGYGAVTVTLPTNTTPVDKANIADHLLSTFSQVDAGIFGPGGVPLSVATGGGGTALSFAGPDALGDSLSFFLDMQQLLARQRGKEHATLDALGYNAPKHGDGSYGPGPATSRWNIWATGRYTDFDDDSAGADRDGDLWSITSGLSYALDERTTVGAFTRMRQGDVSSIGLKATLDSDFFGGGVFFATTLPIGVRVMGAGLFEGGDNDIVISGDSGAFDTDQWTLETRIDKRFSQGRNWIEPAIGLLYSDISRGGYTDSSGTLVSGSDTTLGRLTFGPTIGTTIERGGASLKPFARISGVWDFENYDDFTLSNGTTVSNAEIAVNLAGGLEIDFANGVTMSASGDWSGFNDGLDALAITGSIGMPLSALGLGPLAPAGLVALGFSGNQEGASANATISIPLGPKAD